MKNCAQYNHETVKFTFDMRPESEYNTGLLYGMARQSKEWNPYIDGEFSFACSKDNPRIQVVDLFARETMKALDNSFGPNKRPPRKSLSCLLETERFHVEAFSTEWFEDLKLHMSDLEKSTGMSMADYARWLAATKRNTDSISNRFDYIRYVIARDGE